MRQQEPNPNDNHRDFELMIDGGAVRGNRLRQSPLWPHKKANCDDRQQPDRYGEESRHKITDCGLRIADFFKYAFASIRNPQSAIKASLSPVGSSAIRAGKRQTQRM